MTSSTFTSTQWALAALAARRPPTPHRPPGRHRGRGEHGEGVISAAIAVLIMAFLGAAMWIGFQQMWTSTEATTNQKVAEIGQ